MKITERQLNELLEDLGTLRLCDADVGGVYVESINLAIQVVKEYKKLVRAKSEEQGRH